eukprot:TRINITY_DN26063_c0_g1_i1.p1 TRINITY_DN26063_c0_g1~~TRINITY_DN26063_c0_g1_i1.p1  ORF type:complete len:213 (+),score=12.15 TRINITY_DN26063_c0_g1_i1:88-726(+)
MSLPKEAEDLVQRLQLEPLLPEGGFFRRTHYSDMSVKAPFGDCRAVNAILYMMLRNDCSKMHKLKMDETWHFYHGSPVVLVELDASAPGHCRKTRLGSVLDGLCPQYTVTAGTWFGAFPEGELSLVGSKLTLMLKRRLSVSHQTFLRSECCSRCSCCFCALRFSSVRVTVAVCATVHAVCIVCADRFCVCCSHCTWSAHSCHTSCFSCSCCF